MGTELNIVNNTGNQRFEVELDGDIAYIAYRYYKKDIAFLHTVVPDKAKGKGVASAMATVALDFAKTQHKKIMLYCPFVSKYVKDHAEYHPLVDTNFHPSFLFDK